MSASNSVVGSSTKIGFRRRLKIKARARLGDKILPSNVLPCVVGIGAVVASVPGMPALAPFVGQFAIEQGRRRPQGKDKAPLEGSGMQRIAVGDDTNESDEEHNINDDDDDDDEEDDDDDDDEQELHDDSREEDGTGEEQSRESRNAAAQKARGHTPSPRSSTPAPVAIEEQGADPGELEGVASGSGQHSFTSPLRSSTNAMSPQGSAKSALAASTGSGGYNGGILDKSGKGNANPLMNFTSQFNELRGKATAAVNDVFGQTFGVDFAQGAASSSRSSPLPPPAWHPQRNRKRTGRKSTSVREQTSKSMTSLAGNSRHSLSTSPFASSATLGDDGALATPDMVLAQYDEEARRRLLRSNYCRKQTDFLQALQDISARLLLIPKPARLSALRAELTALNHQLPSEVCFPLWCKAEEANDGQETRSNMPEQQQQRADKGATQRKRGRHHRVVRINPSEAVVLNSADRVPFLLHVEVLDNDLDFDPNRRQNREGLKTLVMQEDVRRRKMLMSRNFSGSGMDVSKHDDAVQGSSDSAAVAEREKSKVGIDKGSSSSPTHKPETLAVEQSSSNGALRPPTPLARSLPAQSQPLTPKGAEEDEEIDLTEQAYGEDLAAFGEERVESESEDDDLSRMNLSHDTAAWSHARGGGSVAPAPAALTGQKASQAKRDFSLDEYSERMRTAAVMLAQLNQSTNASAHPIANSNPHVSSTAQGGWSSWIIGTSWASGAQPGGLSEVGQGSAGVKAPLPNGLGTSGSSTNLGSGAASPSGAGAGGANDGSGGGGSGSGSGVARQGALAAAVPAKGGKKLMHTDTEMIRKRIMQEMMALEEERMERMKANPGSRRRNGVNVEDEATVQRAVNKDDPSAAMFRESWAAKKARIRAASPYGHYESWDVFSVIVKTGADLRQEQLAVQLIQEFSRIWAETGCRCWVRYFRILVTSENSGIMETVTDSVSVHSIKKEAYSRNSLLANNGDQPGQPNGGKIATYSLWDHYLHSFGDASSAKLNRARDRFMESLAGYSIISYLLQIKDRHNGNILVDGDGRLIHIDFGFMLGISPGGVGFEAAPFKLTQEYIDILGGLESERFAQFKNLVKQGFRDVRKHAERIITIVELMQKGEHCFSTIISRRSNLLPTDSKLPCFALGELTATYLRDRFQLALSQSQCDDFVDRLILGSVNSTFTRLYDQYQYYSEGILS